jgi:molecular chaperone GrpE
VTDELNEIEEQPELEQGDDPVEGELETAAAEDEAASGAKPEEELSELEQLSIQAAEYLEGWQRARAELANYKKRVERERRESYQRAAGDILVKQLEILDDLQRALEDRPQEGPAASWADGIDMVQRKFNALIESHNIETIDAAGQPFDPNIHEAISHEESDEVDEGYVIEVIKPGYRLGERVLRPALVRVAK